MSKQLDRIELCKEADYPEPDNPFDETDVIIPADLRDGMARAEIKRKRLIQGKPLCRPEEEVREKPVNKLDKPFCDNSKGYNRQFTPTKRASA